MKGSNQSIIAIVAMLFFVPACTKSTLVGHWKLTKMIKQGPDIKLKTMDLTKPELLKDTMYQIFIQSGRSEGWDTLSAMENIDKMVESWKKTGIRFSADATFLCSNYGLIMSTALPGAHFSDTLGGKWLQKSDTLILSFGTEPYYFQWKYIVVPTPKHELRLQEMIRGNELSGTEFIFISEK